MTVRLLRDSGCRVAGLVMNGYDADVAVAEDPSVISNRRWLEKLTGASVLAVVPRVASQGVMPHRAQLDPAIIDAAALVAWLDVLQPPRRQD
jgi:dethiobiotin synthetase